MRKCLDEEETAMTVRREGGCLCGAVRYALRGEPIAVVYCHCSMCRRACGAPVVAWAMFALDAYEVTAGSPAVHASSPGAQRTFCGRCGTQVGFEAEYMPGLVDVTVASLDDPAALPPTQHIWDASRVPWLALADTLPRHAEFPPQPRAT
jgi:hypothetical protein